MSHVLANALIAHGLLAEADLWQALSATTARDVPLVEAVGSYLPGERVADLLAELTGCARRDHVEPDARFAKALPAAFIQRCLLLPIGKVRGAAEVAFVDPSDVHVRQEVARLLRREVVARVVTVETMRRWLSAVPLAKPPALRANFALAGKSTGTLGPTNSRLRPSLPPPRHGLSASAPISVSVEIPLDTFQQELSWRTGATRHAPGTRRTNVRTTIDPSNNRRAQEDLVAQIATLRAASNPDRVVETLLTFCLAHGRQAFAFRVKGQTLVGMDSAGSTLGGSAVRRIELPMTPGSVPHGVLTSGVSHFGALGFGTTDQVLRAALGSRGTRLSIHGLWVETRPVALVVVDDVHTDEAGHERLSSLAHAASQTLRRLAAERPS